MCLPLQLLSVGGYQGVEDLHRQVCPHHRAICRYKESKGLKDFGVGQWLGNAYNFDEYEFARLSEINRMLGNTLDLVILGGAAFINNSLF